MAGAVVSLARTPMISEWRDYLRFRDAFAEVLDPRFYTLEWLDGEVACGRMMLFNTRKSAILFSVKTYPTGLKELVGELAVGNLREIAHVLIPLAEQFGKEIGCKSAVIESREGWVKMMRAHGYELHQTAIRKVL
jgi:hypothetical protein